MASIFFKTRARVRGWYLLAWVTTISAGLTSRCFPEIFPAVLGKYPGDALWSLMVFFGFGFMFPTASSVRIALYALATSFAVEILKLWQVSWLVQFRHTTIGHLIFGQAFSWNNLAAYGVGIMLGLLIESLIRPLNQPPAD